MLEIAKISKCKIPTSLGGGELFDLGLELLVFLLKVGDELLGVSELLLEGEDLWRDLLFYLFGTSLDALLLGREDRLLWPVLELVDLTLLEALEDLLEGGLVGWSSGALLLSEGRDLVHDQKILSPVAVEVPVVTLASDVRVNHVHEVDVQTGILERGQGEFVYVEGRRWALEDVFVLQAALKDLVRSQELVEDRWAHLAHAVANINVLRALVVHAQLENSQLRHVVRTRFHDPVQN